MTDKPKFAILREPFERHSEGMRERLLGATEYIIFCDNGLARRFDGKWTVDHPSPEADAFVAGKCDPQVPD